MKFVSKVLVAAISMMFISQDCISQSANIWHFGRSIGLDFNTEPPSQLYDGAFEFFEGAASISDRKGDLLFYTDGQDVYNRDHSIMPNGTGLFGHWSSFQSAIIVPWPDSSDLYFVFTTAIQQSGNYNYSVVDMRMDGGFGDVVIKNEVLIGPNTEKLSAVRQLNTKNYWVVGQQWGTEDFYAYPVTSQGVGSPVISSGAPDVSVVDAAHSLRFNGRGDWMVYQTSFPGRLTFAPFDRSTGIVSNFYSTLPGLRIGGLEFSPDDHWLYVSLSNGDLLQYDMTSPTPSALLNSDSLLLRFSDPNELRIALGPNGKIYGGTWTGSTLSMLAQPDSAGLKCEPHIDTINYTYVGSSGPVLQSLPNYMPHQVRLPRIQYVEGCIQEALPFYLSTYSPVDSAVWNFDDPLSGAADWAFGDTVTHNFSESGFHEITLSVFRWGYWDTIRCVVEVDEMPQVLLPMDTTLVSGSSITLDATWPDATYLWSTGSTDATIIVDTAGIYSVTIVSSGGCTDFHVITVNNPDLPDGLFTIEEKIAVYPNPFIGVCHFEFPQWDTWQLELYNNTGQQVLLELVVGSSFDVDFSDLLSGIYTLIARNSAQQYYQVRLIKSGF